MPSLAIALLAVLRNKAYCLKSSRQLTASFFCTMLSKVINSNSNLRHRRQCLSSAFNVFCLAIGILGFLIGAMALYNYSSFNLTSWDGNGTVGGSVAPAPGFSKRRRVLGFVGVQTGFGSTERRKALRKTWFPSDPQSLRQLEESTGLAFRFVIGKTGDETKMAELRGEAEEYDDFLMLDDIEESYSNLPAKTISFFRAAYESFDADFYVKLDDDVYLRPGRLSLLLQRDRPHPLTYIGCMHKGLVLTDPGQKWYEPRSDLLGHEYFSYAGGSIYALSYEVVENLVGLRRDVVRLFSNEDVTIGAWMLAMNVHHEDDRALCEPECRPSSVAVWDDGCSGLCNPEARMLELHEKEICRG
ncbi:probable beta-1,3-galactosyltransferase 14 isoform X1 [Asparagus officinalis]|uniref:probable beta-1,3-galactosyltransferase 14 isoform X1 n=3 Tax=Asparagus officinalis TaxID=4686 RepID=UPI00098E1774|nr:probable beta-1,3-galactosyltransferase 14 isoform X1 [Asparagus officinalis]